MGIIIYLGNVGSGKTACAVREIARSTSKRKYYSNIETNKLKNNIVLKPEMIIEKQIIDTRRKRSGEEVPIYEMKLNLSFWKDIKEPISVVLDEAHSILNARRSMAKANILITDWLALIRRVLGQNSAGYGDLIMITQLPNRIDTIARDMAHQVRYHVCHYVKTCRRCHVSWKENSEMPEPAYSCISCGSDAVSKHSHYIEVWHYRSMESYETFRNIGQQTAYRHYFIGDIERYFPLYDTLQWDNLFSEFY